jgi:sugar phosphate isomerase/epimerase
MSDEPDEVDSKRRRVLQAVGAGGVASAIMGSASARSEEQGQIRTHDTTDPAPPDQEIPISTDFYSYRDTDLSTTDLIQEAADAGYDAFEPYRVGVGDDGTSIVDAMDDTGLEMSSARVSIDAIEDDPDAAGETFSQFGAPLLVDTSASPDWSDESAITAFADRCDAVADQLADHGLEFAHRNGEGAFTEVGTATGYDLFASSLDAAAVQLDAGAAFVGGRDPIRFVTDHHDRVRSIHMKNMTADGDPTDIHEGDVNMRAVATAARNAGNTINAEHLVFAHDNPDNPLESMQTGADWLSRLNQPWQPGGPEIIEGADVHPAKRYTPDA